jgi:hypothetical protein
VAIVVHHRHGIDWAGITRLIAERVLQHPDALEVLCRECHQYEHLRDLVCSKEEKPMTTDERITKAEQLLRDAADRLEAPGSHRALIERIREFLGQKEADE